MLLCCGHFPSDADARLPVLAYLLTKAGNVAGGHVAVEIESALHIRCVLLAAAGKRRRCRGCRRGRGGGRGTELAELPELFPLEFLPTEIPTTRAMTTITMTPATRSALRNRCRFGGWTEGPPIGWLGMPLGGWPQASLYESWSCPASFDDWPGNCSLMSEMLDLSIGWCPARGGFATPNHPGAPLRPSVAFIPIYGFRLYAANILFAPDDNSAAFQSVYLPRTIPPSEPRGQESNAMAQPCQLRSACPRVCRS